MRIKVTSMPISQYGTFHPGDILTDEDGKYPVAFLNHLVDDCHAAERLDYETKPDKGVTVKKKALSSQSLPQAKASPKKIVKSRKVKAK